MQFLSYLTINNRIYILNYLELDIVMVKNKKRWLDVNESQQMRVKIIKLIINQSIVESPL